MGNRIGYIDFAKGFAILAIVCFHYLQPFAKGFMAHAIMFGGSGVHLFFILSGFGLALSSQNTTLDFYTRRGRKILIPYFISVSLIAAVNVFVPIYDDGLYAFGGHLFLYKMFDNSIITSYGYHLWFMSSIIQLYILFPFLYRIKWRIGIPAFTISTLAVSVIWWFSVTTFGLSGRVFESFCLQYLWEFSAGMVLAEMYKSSGYKFWEQSRAWLFTCAVVGPAITVALAIKGGQFGRAFNDIFSAIGIFSISAIAYSFLTKFMIDAISWVGGISFELYLLHMFIFALFRNYHAHDIFTAFSVVLPISIFVAYSFSALLKTYRSSIIIKSYRSSGF